MKIEVFSCYLRITVILYVHLSSIGVNINDGINV